MVNGHGCPTSIIRLIKHLIVLESNFHGAKKIILNRTWPHLSDEIRRIYAGQELGSLLGLIQ